MHAFVIDGALQLTQLLVTHEAPQMLLLLEVLAVSDVKDGLVTIHMVIDLSRLSLGQFKHQQLALVEIEWIVVVHGSAKLGIQWILRLLYLNLGQLLSHFSQLVQLLLIRFHGWLSDEAD